MPPRIFLRDLLLIFTIIRLSISNETNGIEMFSYEKFGTTVYTNFFISVKYTKTLIFLHGAAENASYYSDMFTNGDVVLPMETKVIIIQSPLKSKT